MAAHGYGGWDTDERVIETECEAWAGSGELEQNIANEAQQTSARHDGGKTNESDHSLRQELEIGPYVSAESQPLVDVNNLFTLAGSPDNKLSPKDLPAQQIWDIPPTCDNNPQVNKRSERFHEQIPGLTEFDSLQFGENDIENFKAGLGQRRCDQHSELCFDQMPPVTTSNRFDDVIHIVNNTHQTADTRRNETNRDDKLLSLNMDRDSIGVEMVRKPENTYIGINSDEHTDIADSRTNVDTQNSSNRSGSTWHCHNKRTDDRDNLARNQLVAVCVLCATFMIGEGIGGVLSNSLALFTDVLHLASDLISFLISLLAIYLSRKQATKTMSFGYYRAEVLGALFSVFIIWLVTGVLCYMAAERIMHKHYINVKADQMLITASLGVVFNIVMGIVLHSEKCCGSAQAKFGHGHSHSHGSSSQRHTHNVSQDQHDHAYQPLLENGSFHEMQSPLAEKTSHKHRHKNINVRAAFIHVIGDIIQSIGVLIASLIIKFKPEEEYKLADPICTFLFSLLVILTTITVLRDTLRVMMEGVPRDINYSAVVSDLKSLEGVVTVHSLCIWCLTLDKNALSVHLAIDESHDHQKALEQASLCLKENHNIFHLTIQVENCVPAIMDSCDTCKHHRC